VPLVTGFTLCTMKDGKISAVPCVFNCSALGAVRCNGFISKSPPSYSAGSVSWHTKESFLCANLPYL